MRKENWFRGALFSLPFLLASPPGAAALPFTAGMVKAALWGQAVICAADSGTESDSACRHFYGIAVSRGLEKPATIRNNLYRIVAHVDNADRFLYAAALASGLEEPATVKNRLYNLAAIRPADREALRQLDAEIEQQLYTLLVSRGLEEPATVRNSLFRIASEVENGDRFLYAAALSRSLEEPGIVRRNLLDLALNAPADSPAGATGDIERVSSAFGVPTSFLASLAGLLGEIITVTDTAIITYMGPQIYWWEMPPLDSYGNPIEGGSPSLLFNIDLSHSVIQSMCNYMQDATEGTNLSLDQRLAMAGINTLRKGPFSLLTAAIKGVLTQSAKEAGTAWCRDNSYIL